MEKHYRHGERQMTYETEGSDFASVRFTHDGKVYELSLHSAPGGGASVGGAPPEWIEAVTALSLHIWPRRAVPHVITTKKRGW